MESEAGEGVRLAGGARLSGEEGARLLLSSQLAEVSASVPFLRKAKACVCVCVCGCVCVCK